jgi:hypothetical protein
MFHQRFITKDESDIIIDTAKQDISASVEILLDLFDNPVGYLTNLAVFQAKALQNRGFQRKLSGNFSFRTTLMLIVLFRRKTL